MTDFIRKILVVEDEVLIRFAICDYLEDAGFDVYQAGDVLTAVGLIGKHEQFIAVISDIDLPGALNGIDLVNLIAQTSPKTKIIITSARDPEHCMGIPEGAVYLQKPYSDQVIFDVLQTHRQMLETTGAIRYRA